MANKRKENLSLASVHLVSSKYLVFRILLVKTWTRFVINKKHLKPRHQVRNVIILI